MNLKVSDAKREEGFTLIELLVVVIIIGILAAIAIPVFLNQRERAWQGSVESDVRNAAIQVETDATRSGTYRAPFLEEVEISDSVSLFYRGLNAAGTTEAAGGSEIAFQLCGQHLNLAAQSAVYDSTAGGLQAWNDGPTESCSDISEDFDALLGAS